MRRRSDQLTEDEARELEEIYRDAYSEAYQEAYQKPLKYLHHDTGAHVDDEMRLLSYTSGGLEAYGRYWVLMELLASRRGHLYDVGDETGWMFLASDMSTCGVPIDAAACRELVETLVSFDKLDREAYEVSHHIVSGRVSRQAAAYAEEYATSKAAGIKSARKRQMLSGKEE